MREREIIELIRARDENGVHKLIMHYGPLIRYIVSPILHNEQDVEECVSETVMRIWDKIDLYDPDKGSWNAWLTALTRNTALSAARRNKRFDAADEIDTDIPSAQPTPEETVVLNERRAALDKALRQLTSKEKMLFYRKYYYMQSTAQIASELGMTQRAVEGKLYRLKKQLREILGGERHE